MTASEEREVAARKEMAVMYEEGVTCEGTAVEGARVPAAAVVPATAVPSTTAGKASTAPVPSTTATKTAPPPCIAIAVEPMPSAAMAISAMSVLRNIDFPPRKTATELRKRCRWLKNIRLISRDLVTTGLQMSELLTNKLG